MANHYAVVLKSEVYGLEVALFLDAEKAAEHEKDVRKEYAGHGIELLEITETDCECDP